MIDVRTYNEHMQALATTLSELAARVRQLEAVQIPTAGVFGPHDILSVTHTDSTPQAVSQGSLIVGDKTPTWNELVIGGLGAGSLVTRDATDVLWSAYALSGTAGQTYTFPPASATLVGGTGVANRVAYWTGANSIGGEAEFTYDPALDFLLMTSANSSAPILQLENTNADTASSFVVFYKNTASPADNDYISTIRADGETSTGARVAYGGIYFQSADVTNGDEAGAYELTLRMDATGRSFLKAAGYNGVVNQGEIIINEDAQDVDFRIEAVGVADALQVRGSDGQITLGVLTAGYVNSDAGGVLSVTATATPTAHAILSASHSDTTPAAVVRGDLMTGQAGPVWARLALGGAAGSFLRRDATDVLWSTLVLPNAATTGDILYASGANTIGNLADVAVGQALVSGGVGVAPAWSASPTLTGLTLSGLTASTVIYSNAAKAITSLANAAGYLTNNGAGALSWSATATPTAHNLLSASHGDTTVQAVSRGSVITGQGAVPTWNELVIGGLGAGSVLTRDANEVLWSAGALSFAGAFTLTIPATGTAVLGGGSGAATRVAYWSDANTLTSDAGFTYTAATDSVNAGDYFVTDGGQFGISGNELLTANAAGTFAFSGIAGVTVENADWIGNGAASARLGFDSSGATDYAYFSNCNVGVNTSTPDAVVEIVGEYYDIVGADVRGLYISGTYSEIAENHHPCRVSSLHDLGTGKAVACFDADGRTTGTRNHDHMVGFQSRPRHGSTGTIRSIGGFTASLYNDGGRATQTYCYYANDLNSGNSDCHYGLWVEPLVTGDENVAIYVQTPTMSIFEGVVGFGDFGTPGSGADVPEGLVHCKTDTYTETGLFERIFKTDGVGTALRVLGTKTIDMGDGAGAEVGFLIQDDAAVLNFIGGIGAYRNGADNTGNVRIATRSAGVEVVTATFTYQGRTGLGTVSPSGMVHIDQSAAVGAIPALYLDQGDVSEQHIVLSMNGADQDFPNILQLDVTGSPALWWDESENAFGWKNINGLLVEDADWIGNSSTTARLVFDSSGANDYVNFANCTVFINDTANTKMPHPGLTIRQTDDYEIISLKNSDCDHPMTDETEADTFLRIYPADVGVNRGSSPQIDGFVDDDADRPGAGIWIGGNAYSADSTDTAASVGCVNLIGYESDGGTGRQAVGNDDNVIGFHNAGNTIAVMKGDGDLFLAGAVTENDWDEHDDLALLDGLRLKERFARWSTYARPILEASNVVKYNQDGPDFISVRNLQMLTVDALRQFATQALAEIATLKQRVAILEAA